MNNIEDRTVWIIKEVIKQYKDEINKSLRGFFDDKVRGRRIPRVSNADIDALAIFLLYSLRDVANFKKVNLYSGGLLDQIEIKSDMSSFWWILSTEEYNETVNRLPAKIGRWLTDLPTNDFI